VPGATAHLAVFYVVLDGAPAGVEEEFDLGAAVGAPDLGGAIGKILACVLVVISDH